METLKAWYLGSPRIAGRNSRDPGMSYCRKDQDQLVYSNAGR